MLLVSTSSHSFEYLSIGRLFLQVALLFWSICHFFVFCDFICNLLLSSSRSVRHPRSPSLLPLLLLLLLLPRPPRLLRRRRRHRRRQLLSRRVNYPPLAARPPPFFNPLLLTAQLIAFSILVLSGPSWLARHSPRHAGRAVQQAHHQIPAPARRRRGGKRVSPVEEISKSVSFESWRWRQL
jgi:hypothetical protein